MTHGIASNLTLVSADKTADIVKIADEVKPFERFCYYMKWIVATVKLQFFPLSIRIVFITFY